MLISFHQAFGTCSRKNNYQLLLVFCFLSGKSYCLWGDKAHLTLFFMFSLCFSGFLFPFFLLSSLLSFFISFSIMFPHLLCCVCSPFLAPFYYLNNLGKMWFMHYTDAVFLFCSCQCLCAQLKIRSVAQNVLQVFLIITCYLFIVFIYVLFLYLEVYHAITVDGYVCFWACTQNCLVCQYAAGYWYWMWHIGFI